MSILPHTITGAVIGSFTTNSMLAFLYGVITHLILDFIPHYDPDLRTHRKKPLIVKLFYIFALTVDISLSLVILYYLIKYPNLFWGAIGGIIPDVDNFLQYRFKIFPLLSKIGIPIHNQGTSWHNKLKFKPGFLNVIIGALMQAVICLIGLLIIYARTS